MTEYIAFVLIGAGSTWGRSKDKEEAITEALNQLRGWDQYYDVYDKDVRVNIMDATGYDEVSWDDNGMYGTREGGDGKYENIDRPIERITRRAPPKKRKTA
jgi:hypothetical protein